MWLCLRLHKYSAFTSTKIGLSGGFKPEVGFEDQCPVLVPEQWIGKVVVCVDDEDIAHRFEPPLKPAIHIEIVVLVVVLKKSCPEQIIGEIHFDPGCEEQQGCFSIRFREMQSGLFGIDRKVTPGLSAPGQGGTGLQDTTIEETSGP
jgi:hypothetical protein